MSDGKKTQPDNPEYGVCISDIPKILQQTFIRKDINLLHHMGYFASQRSKANSRKVTGQVTFQGKPFRYEYTVKPHPEFGSPGQLAYMILDWIDMQLTYYGTPAANPLFFDMRTLLSITGMSKSGQNYQLIKRALDQLRHTEITTTYYRLNKQDFVRVSFRVIDTIGEYGKDDQVKGGLIYLSQPILDAFNGSMRTRMNLLRYRQLSANCRKLYFFLHHAFSAAHKSGNPLVFTKNYSQLCPQLDFTPYKHRSRIIQQFNRHVKALMGKKIKLIKSFDVVPNKDGGFNLVFEAHEDFIQDEMDPGGQKELPFPASPKNRKPDNGIEAVEMAMQFLKKRYGTSDPDSSRVIQQEDISRAQEILALLPRTGSIHKEFIDWALAQANEQKYEVKYISGLKSFVAPFLAIHSNVRKKISKKKKEADMDKAESLFFSYLDHIYNEYSETLSHQASTEQADQLHKKAIEISAVKFKFQENGAEDITYQKEVEYQQRLYAKKNIASVKSWEAYSSEAGFTEGKKIFQELMGFI